MAGVEQGALQGKVVLVTGAAKRIGRAVALRLAAEGARVALHYSTSETEANATADDCAAVGPRPELFRANLEHVAEIRQLFSDVAERMGPLYGLVNNAARFTRFDPLEVTEADWDFIHDVNLKAVFFCCQEAARQMKQSGQGRIVNLSSLGGLRPWAHHAHYCASKAGVIMLTKALAKALAPEVTINSVAPGVIPFGEWNDVMQDLLEATPMQRVGKGDEVADAVHYFLTCPGFITGQLLAVDGGLSHR